MEDQSLSGHPENTAAVLRDFLGLREVIVPVIVVAVVAVVVAVAAVLAVAAVAAVAAVVVDGSR